MLKYLVILSIIAMSEEIEVLKGFNFLEYLQNGASVEKYEKEILALYNVVRKYCAHVYDDEDFYFPLPHNATAFLIDKQLRRLYPSCYAFDLEIYHVKRPEADNTTQILISHEGHLILYNVDARGEYGDIIL